MTSQARHSYFVVSWEQVTQQYQYTDKTVENVMPTCECFDSVSCCNCGSRRGGLGLRRVCIRHACSLIIIFARRRSLQLHQHNTSRIVALARAAATHGTNLVGDLHAASRQQRHAGSAACSCVSGRRQRPEIVFHPTALTSRGFHTAESFITHQRLPR